MKTPTQKGRALMQIHRVVPQTKRENYYMRGKRPSIVRR